MPSFTLNSLVNRSITRHQAEYRYDGGLYLRSTSILKTSKGSQVSQRLKSPLVMQSLPTQTKTVTDIGLTEPYWGWGKEFVRSTVVQSIGRLAESGACQIAARWNPSLSRIPPTEDSEYTYSGGILLL